MRKWGFLCLSLFLLAGSLFAANDDYSTWATSRTITLNTSATGAKVTTNQLNFPVLVRLTTANANAFFASEATSGLLGADLRFAKMDGTHLAYEMKYDAANKKVTAWVKLDTVFGNSATQKIKYYWGKTGAADSSISAAVFTPANGYAAVYHFNKRTGTGPYTYSDATGQGQVATADSATTDTTGVFDRAVALHITGDGSQYLSGDSITVAGLLGSPATVTLSAWVRCDTLDQYSGSNWYGQKGRGNIMSIGDNVGISACGLDGTPNDSLWGAYHYSSSSWYNQGWPSPSQPGTNAQLNLRSDTGHALLHQGWRYATVVFDPTDGFVKYYLNGDSVKYSASTNQITYTQGTRTVFGKHNNWWGQHFGGSLAEARFENVARSTDWIRLCYQNQQAIDSLTKVDTIAPIIGEDYTTWAGHKTLTLNTSTSGANIKSNQVNFPMLVRLTSANSAEVFTGSLSSGGADIRFAKADGTHLQYELSKWDPTKKYAVFWVLMDTVKAASTTQSVTMYWGKSGVVSKSDSSKVFAPANGYVTVLHLNKSYTGGTGANNFYDATGQGNNGWTNGTTDTSSVIDRGRYFKCSGDDGTDPTAGDSVVVNGFLGSPAVVTLSTWVKVDSIDQATDQYAGSGHRGIIMGIGDNVGLSNGGNLSDGNTDSLWGSYHSSTGNTWNNFGYTAPSGHTMWHKGWSHAALVLNPKAGYEKLYLNGDSVAAFALTDTIAYTVGKNFVIGKHASGQYGQKLGGAVCEARVENVERPSDWLKLCFMNQGSTDKLLGLVVTGVAPQRGASMPATMNMANFQVKAGAICYSLKTPGMVQLSMSDVRGRTVWSSQAMRNAGSYQVKLSNIHLAAGSYVVRFKAAGVEKQSIIMLDR